jgi:hypothetical protein
MSSSASVDQPPRRWPLRAAGVVYLANAVGFGVGAALTLPYLARRGELPMTPFGFRAFSGLFETLGCPWFSLLLWSFVGLAAVEALAGVWLWRGERRGLVLGLATTPLGAALGAGFALPLYLASLPLRMVLLFLGRRAKLG